MRQVQAGFRASTFNELITALLPFLHLPFQQWVSCISPLKQVNLRNFLVLISASGLRRRANVCTRTAGGNLQHCISPAAAFIWTEHNHNIELLHSNSQEAVDYVGAVYIGPRSVVLISAFSHEKASHARKQHSEWKDPSNAITCGEFFCTTQEAAREFCSMRTNSTASVEYS